jgi:hypothetical protein
MPDYLGADQRKTKEDEKDDKPIRGQLMVLRRAGRQPAQGSVSSDPRQDVVAGGILGPALFPLFPSLFPFPLPSFSLALTCSPDPSLLPPKFFIDLLCC